MEKKTVFDQVVAALKDLGNSKVFVHVSSPCSSGSPLRNFRGDDTATEADVIWFDVIPHVAKYMKLGKYSSFELPFAMEECNLDSCHDHEDSESSST